MNQRKRLIQETISVILSEVLDTAERRKDTLAKVNRELAKADRRTLELARQGYPDEHAHTIANDNRYYRMKALRDRIMTRMNEAKRNPDEILGDIRSTEKDIDRTFDNNQHHPHVKRLDKLHAEYMKVTGQRPPSAPEPTNESNLNELYSFAGLYARAIGNKRELSPEEQARGDNPYLTPEGKTTYPTGPLAKIMGAREYVNRASSSLQRTNRLKDQLYDDYLQLAGSVRSGRFKGVTTQDDVDQLLNPRMQQISRILDKNIKRNNRRFKVERENRQALAKLPPLPDPNEPPHTFG